MTVFSGLMTALMEAASSPLVLLGLALVAMTGPVGLVAALVERGWTPVRAVRRWRTRRAGMNLRPRGDFR